MAKTESTMVALGTQAPDFQLPDTDGKLVRLADFAEAPALLVMFICNHCPFVKHVADVLATVTRDFIEQGVAVVAISSNDAENYPEDSPAKMRVEKQARGYAFPYLYDATQAVARAYDAACTPDFYIFDKQRRLAYRGQMDSSRPGNNLPVTGEDLRQALAALLSGKPVTVTQKPSIGCNIKWRS